MNTLRQAVDEYLEMRRSLGFKLKDDGTALHNFVAFMERHRASYITQRLALAWAQRPKNVQPTRWAARLCYVRGFARHRKSTDPRTQVPPVRLLPFCKKRARPYLYSNKEIRQLLRAALDMPLAPKHRNCCALLPWVYSSLIGLLSVSGLRLGEALNLELRDVDLNGMVLTIRNGKWGKDRLVPIHASTCRALVDYIARRRRRWAGRAVSSYLFVSSRGNRLDAAQVHRTFNAISKRIGLRGASDSRGPRLHDFRHRLASEALWRWHRAGEEPERKLTALSAFLGHVHWSDTFWYLTATPTLMRGAMRRLEHHWKQRL
jgi:integrase/recombinase XerD